MQQILHRPVFQRTAHGRVLTRFGTEFSRRIKLATLEIEGAAEQIQSIFGVIRARITVGIPQLANSTFLGITLSKLMHMHREIQLLVTERPRQILLQELRFGRLDIVYGTLRRNSPGDDFIEEPLFRDPYCIAARNGHPLANRQPISIDDLTQYSWIRPQPGTIRHDIFENIFAKHPLKPRTAVETSSLNIHISFLQTSDYLAIMKKEEIRIYEKLGSLTTLPVHLENMYGIVGLTTRAGWHPTHVQARLLDIMREHASGFDRHIVPPPL